MSSFTMTCDIWTDVSNKSYLEVTIHYLKTETLLTKGTIGVIPLEIILPSILRMNYFRFLKNLKLIHLKSWQLLPIALPI